MRKFLGPAAIAGLCLIAGILVFFSVCPPRTVKARIIESYGKLPLRFEANRGQIDGPVQFFSRGSGYTLLLTSTEAVLDLGGREKGSVLRMNLRGANPKPVVAGLEELPGKSNYFIGNDPTKWRTNVPNYAKIAYQQVYPGVDLVYYGSNQRQLEYDFVVAPGADPKTIRLAFRGAEKVEIDPQGDLRLTSGSGQVRMHRPVVYQEVAGVKRNLSGNYVLEAEHEVGFQVSEYDSSRPLVIDPVLSYSTYIGGSSDDIGNGIAVDATGNAYITGYTRFPGTFPTTAGAFQRVFGNPASDSYDAFVVKLNAAGSALDYSTYLGGTLNDFGQAIAVDSDGNAYVTGYTNSTNFPTTLGGVQPSFGGGANDAFVTKLNPTGSALVYSSYLGGSGDDVGYKTAVDPSGNAYVTGRTNSTNFPTLNPVQATFGGAFDDAFVTKLNPAGSAMIYSTYLGGSGRDGGVGIAADSSGNAYVAGYTSSNDFPTVSPLQATYGGGDYDTFVAKFNATGTLAYSTYRGDGNLDEGQDIAVDSFGNAYVVGITAPAGTTNYDVVVFKLNAAGSALVYLSNVRSLGIDVGNRIAVDGTGNAYIAGYTNSANFPSVNGLQPAGGDYDAFVAKIDPSGLAFVYSTYLGGSGADYGIGVAIDPAGNAYVVGYTKSSDFPVTGGAFQTSYGGGGVNDVFVAKIGFSNPVPAITAISPTRATAGGPTFSLTVNGSGFTGSSVVRWNGSDRLTTFINGAQLMVFEIPASDIAVAGTLPVTVFNPAPGGGLTSPVTFTVMSSSGVVTAGTTSGSPAATATIPVTLALSTGSVDSLSFGLQVVPNGIAPALTGTLSFTKDPALPTPSFVDTASGPNAIAVSWIPPTATISLSGTVHLGDVVVNIPSTAVNGQTYTVRITGVSASLSSAGVGLLPAPTTTLTVGGTYLVGDGAPFTADTTGLFGNDFLDNFDLIAALRAVTSIPGARPFSCTDRYDAMDSSPVDGTSRGGDGSLDNFDLIATLRRVTSLDTSRPRRSSRGLSCTSAARGYRVPEPPDVFSADGALDFGPAEGQRIPVYLQARNSVSLAGLSFSLGLAGGRSGQLRFVSAEGRTPSLVDQALPGMIAVAWLEGFTAGAGERILLGYVETDAAESAVLRFYGVSANAQNDGRSVPLAYPKMGSGSIF